MSGQLRGEKLVLCRDEEKLRQGVSPAQGSKERLRTHLGVAIIGHVVVGVAWHVHREPEVGLVDLRWGRNQVRRRASKRRRLTFSGGSVSKLSG